MPHSNQIYAAISLCFSPRSDMRHGIVQYKAEVSPFTTFSPIPSKQCWGLARHRSYDNMIWINMELERTEQLSSKLNRSTEFWMNSLITH